MIGMSRVRRGMTGAVLLAAGLWCSGCSVRTISPLPAVQVRVGDLIAAYHFRVEGADADQSVRYEVTTTKGRRFIASARQATRLDASGQLQVHPMVVTLDGRQLTEVEALEFVANLGITPAHGETERADLLNALKHHGVAPPEAEAGLSSAGSSRKAPAR
jgi:hypothetical protein